MAYDVDADCDPSVEILRGERIIILKRMLDACAETVDDLRSQPETVADVVVRLFEVVVARIVLIRLPVSENMLNIHQSHPRIVQRDIVQARIRNFQRPVCLIHVPVLLIVKFRGEIDAVQCADFADIFVEIDFQICIHILI